MRKKRKLLLALTTPLLMFGSLVGCTNNQGNSSGSSSLTIDTDFKVEFEEMYETDAWDGKILACIGEIAGNENAGLVPSADADLYQFGCTRETDDEGGSMDLAVIRCYGIFERKVEEMYETSLRSKGYQLSSEYPYGATEISLTTDLIVQYELMEDEKGETCFEILVYTYEYRIDYWPGEQIEEIMGESVPEIGADCYEVYTSLTANNNVRISLYAYHMTQSDVDAYETKLTLNGFTISEGGYYHQAKSKSGYLNLMYDYFDGLFTVYISCDWPYLYIVDSIGRDIPKLTSDASNFDWDYVSETGDSEDAVLTLYYDNTSNEDFIAYGALLEKEGYVCTDTRESTGSLTIHVKDYSLPNDNHVVCLMYCVEQKTIAIALY
ncbi:MAG: hypothetical protein MJ238_04565 [Bacilli bacterium]|nr:hypothetical protein [Bacilli bacterium]